jgi:hypothetical protein
MHYKVVASRDVFLTEPSLSSIPQFHACSSKELKFIFLAYDYDGPFRKLERPIRLREAAIAAGYTFIEDKQVFDQEGKDAINFKNVRLQNARDYFMNTIQANDLDLAMLEAYNEQIREYNVILSQKNKKSNDTKLAMQIQKELPAIVELRNKLAQICGHKSDFVDEIKSDKKMSTLDKINAGLLQLNEKTN